MNCTMFCTMLKCKSPTTILGSCLLQFTPRRLAEFRLQLHEGYRYATLAAAMVFLDARAAREQAE